MSAATTSPLTEQFDKPLTASMTSPLTEQFGKLVYEKLEEWHVPGMSIAIVHNDKVYAEVS